MARRVEPRPSAGWAALRRWSGSFKFILAGLVFGAGVLFLVVGVRELADSATFLRETETVVATVERIEEQVIPGATTVDAFVSYVIGGQRYDARLRYDTRPLAPQVGGATVTLRYHPANPAGAVLISTSELWFAGTFFTLFSLLWMGLVAFGGYREWRSSGAPSD